MFSLIQQVSQLARLDEETLRAVADEARAADRRLAHLYTEEPGGWLTLTLLDCEGAGADPLADSPLAEMPRTRAALDELGLDCVTLRLAKLEPNALALEEHEHQKPSRGGRLRLHLPVVTNAATGIVIERLKVFLAPGYVWKLNPVFRHAASNLGTDTHLHLVIECRIDERLDALLKEETLDEGCVECLPVPTRAELDRAVQAAAQLARRGDRQTAEHSLLKLFHLYFLREEVAHELIARMYESLGDSERAAPKNERAELSDSAGDSAPTTTTGTAKPKSAPTLTLVRPTRQ